jgi:hypothetical protein
VASVSDNITHTASSAISTVSTHTSSIIPHANALSYPHGSSSGSKHTPAEELVALFRECCQIIDALADSDDHDSSESDRKLYESKVVL